MYMLHKYLGIEHLFCALMFEMTLFCLFLIICPFLSFGSRIPFSKCLLFFTRTKSQTSSLLKAVSYVLVQHYSTDLLLKWNTAVTFLIPMTFYNLWNLAQQQEFNHIHWCKRQNKAPLHSHRDMTSKVQSLERLTGDPQGQLQQFCLWSACNLWLCFLITPTEILHLHCVPEYFVLAAWALLFSYQKIIFCYVISLFQFTSASQQFQGVNFQGLWFSHCCKVRGFGFTLVLFFFCHSMEVHQQNNLHHSSSGSCLFCQEVCHLCWLMPGGPKEGLKKIPACLSIAPEWQGRSALLNPLPMQWPWWGDWCGILPALSCFHCQTGAEEQYMTTLQRLFTA